MKSVKQSLLFAAFLLLFAGCGGIDPDPDPGGGSGGGTTPPAVVKDVTVGIVQSGMGSTTKGYFIKCLTDAGAYCTVFPEYATTDALAENFVKSVDAVIIPGKFTDDISGRKAHDERVVKAAIAAGKPILGICLGHQHINSALGGTSPKISDNYPNSTVLHKNSVNGTNVGLTTEAHSITIAQDSKLAEILKSTQAMVNTSHEYSVKNLGTGLKATAWADDGVVEALEGTRIMGVQFHPEYLYGMMEIKKFLAIFQNLTDEARAAKAN